MAEEGAAERPDPDASFQPTAAKLGPAAESVVALAASFVDVVGHSEIVDPDNVVALPDAVASSEPTCKPQDPHLHQQFD